MREDGEVNVAVPAGGSPDAGGGEVAPAVRALNQKEDWAFPPGLNRNVVFLEVIHQGILKHMAQAEVILSGFYIQACWNVYINSHS